MPTNLKNGKAKEHHHTGSFVHNVKDTTVLALEGVVDVVADTTSNTLKAGERMSDDFTSLTKRMVFNTIRGVSDVTGVLGQALLENARGGVKGAGVLGQDAGGVAKDATLGAVKGASEVSGEVGQAAKKAAIGFIHGSAEVGAELGKVCKEGAIGAIRGAGEVTAELGALAMKNAMGLIDGGTEATLHLEDGLLGAAAKLFKGINQIKAENAPPKTEENNQPVL